MATVMKNILTADQFVAGIISVLALKSQKHFILHDTQIDEMFEHAFEKLLEESDALNVTPNFNFFIDPLHGDSVTLRETLLAAKEKELIALNNPTFHTFEIKLSEKRANRYLDNGPISIDFFNRIVDTCFSEPL